MVLDPYIGIEMNQKELTKTIMMISNWTELKPLISLYMYMYDIIILPMLSG